MLSSRSVTTSVLMFASIRKDFDTHGRTLRSGGFWAMFVYRFGVWSMNRRFAPWRWLTSALYMALNAFVQATTGVMIERDTRFGEGFHIIHAGLLHIHPDTEIGARVGVMHNVTLGSNMTKGCPTIGDDVFIGCGASVLGEIKVGDGARISANSLVITDVPAGAVAMGVPAQIYPNMDRLRKRKKKPKNAALAEPKPEPKGH